MLLTVLAALVLLLALLMLAVRLAPSDPGRWHVDPFAARDPGPAGVLWKSGPVDARPDELMAALSRAVEATPRTRRLAGGGLHVTWIVRTPRLGFPDYVSARARPVAGGGAELAVLSRLRFGRSDLGVNRARLERWRAALAPLLRKQAG